MDEYRGAQPVPDTPENRRLWLNDFKDESQYILRTLLDAGLVEMTLDGKERGFRLTVIGREKLEKSH